jgi:DNA-binding ferritin-like protein
VGRLGTAARQVSRIGKERGDVTMASESVESLTAQIQALEEDFSQQVAAFDTAIDPQTETLERLAVKPKKTGIQVKLLALAWL